MKNVDSGMYLGWWYRIECGFFVLPSVFFYRGGKRIAESSMKAVRCRGAVLRADDSMTDRAKGRPFVRPWRATRLPCPDRSRGSGNLFPRVVLLLLGCSFREFGLLRVVRPSVCLSVCLPRGQVNWQSCSFRESVVLSRVRDCACFRDFFVTLQVIRVEKGRGGRGRLVSY